MSDEQDSHENDEIAEDMADEEDIALEAAEEGDAASDRDKDSDLQMMTDPAPGDEAAAPEHRMETDEISSRQIDILSAASEIPHHARERRSAFLGVPIDVTVSIGRARPLVSELIKLQRDSVLTLDSKIEDPVELYIGDRLIARGELQEMDDDTGQLGVRLTEVADLSTGV